MSKKKFVMYVDNGREIYPVMLKNIKGSSAEMLITAIKELESSTTYCKKCGMYWPNKDHSQHVVTV